MGASGPSGTPGVGLVRGVWCSAGLSSSSEVTNDVAWEDSLMIGLEGALLGWCVAHLVLAFGIGPAGNSRHGKLRGQKEVSAKLGARSPSDLCAGVS